MKKHKPEQRHENISTKIAADSKARLDAILARMGINEYQWFQLMAEITIRLRDDRHQLSEAMAKLIQMFQMVPGFRDPTTFLDPNSEPEVKGAVYLINSKGKTGLKPVMVDKGWMDGIWNETENVMDIVERIIEVAMPQKHKWLRQEMVRMDCSRVFEFLMKLAEEGSARTLEQEIAELFNDNMRHDTGKPIAYGERTKRKKRLNPDSKEMQKVITFHAEDEPEDNSNY